MGGMSGQITGKTKIACWLRFVKYRDQVLARYQFLPEMVTPGNKREAYRSMVWDNEKDVWILRVRFDK